MEPSVAAIEVALPEHIVTNADIAAEFPEWPIDKIEAITGVEQRHIAGPGECSSDLAIAAAKKLFERCRLGPEHIEYILLCTQTPDYFLPTTACLVQNRLGVPTTAGALDFNLGSSGYIYGLGLAHGLIVSGQVSNVLLLTTDTYSKLIHPKDKSTRTVFGDAATATLIQTSDGEARGIGPFIYGSDGSGAANLIVPAGGFRQLKTHETSIERADESGNIRSEDNLFMNGAEIFTFTLSAVPKCIHPLLNKAGITLQDIDLFVFHQANKYILDHLRKQMKIPADKFYIALRNYGNTVSSTIPIALHDAIAEGRLKPGNVAMLVGFGAGYSWGATLLRL